MAKKQNPVQLQIAVTLNSGAYEFLEKNSKDGDLAGTLAAWSSYWLEMQSRGGLLLEPTDHDFLAEQNGGKRFKDSRSLVKAIEKGMNREAGQYSFTINVDPAHYPALKENAEAGGLTVEEALDGIVQYIFAVGMIYDFTPTQGRSIPFTFDMLQKCKELLDKKAIDSSDIAGLIAEDRFLPITRETQATAKRVLDKQAFLPSDLDAILVEIETLRVENAALKRAPRELVAA